jgi:hypothetical protein
VIQPTVRSSVPVRRVVMHPERARAAPARPPALASRSDPKCSGPLVRGRRRSVERRTVGAREERSAPQGFGLPATGCGAHTQGLRNRWAAHARRRSMSRLAV